ncbi:BHLH domain-containing protein [Mycena venus]|uniref:BHLH domain-containing protein n=1 Tax=Mycena venus TaxID=2733690 RepID=A0A8H6WR11_9AGAR|nr:BHLH domain-containing protein [Mycena venus]
MAQTQTRDSASTPPDWKTLSSMYLPADDPKMGLFHGFRANGHVFWTPVFTLNLPHLSSSAPLTVNPTPVFLSLRCVLLAVASEFRKTLHPSWRAEGARLLVLATAAAAAGPAAATASPAPAAAGTIIQPPPPAFTTTPVPVPVLAHTPITTAPPSRPKTSHTTIERRYCTNLNARIQSLAPGRSALRDVDRAAALKAGEPVEDDGPEDIVDSRGFVDGVKVARKCSKANVLGKAVEYIRVLKNREAGLVASPRGSRRSLGGCRRASCWQSGSASGPRALGGLRRTRGDEEGARKRKKPKVDPKPKPERKAPSAAAPVVEGEKKKRGRPRKVVPLPAQQQEVPHGQRQYLLGAFALFSFFANANVSTPPQTHHAHEGHVLTPRVPVPGSGANLSLLQVFHLLVSAAVLASVLLPIGQSLYARFKGPTTPAPVVVVALPTEKTAASPPPTPTGDDEPATAISTCSASAPHLAAAEACILDDSTPLATRLRTALRLYNSISTSPNVDDRRLLALLVRPVPLLGRRVAGQLWDGGMGLEVDEAARRVAVSNVNTKSPVLLRALEENVAFERLRAVTASAFTREVLSVEADDSKTATEEREHALAAARKLGGRVGVLGARVGRVLGGSDLGLAFDADADGAEEDDVHKLLRAIVLYRRVFLRLSLFFHDRYRETSKRRRAGAAPHAGGAARCLRTHWWRRRATGLWIC